MNKKILPIMLLLIFFFILKPINVSAEDTFSYTITVDNRIYEPVKKDDVHTLLLPSNTDLSKLKISWSNTGWGVSIGDNPINSGELIDLSNDAVTLTAVNGEVTQNVTISAMKGASSVPALYIYIPEEDWEYIHEDKGRVASVKTTILGGGNKFLGGAEAELKGRGNVSWTRAKKSYQIKFNDKKDVLGMGKAKRWILIPASYDLSMVRTAMGFEIAKRLEMEYASEYRYVDLYMGGRYYGLYVLCEKPEIKNNRIDITSIEDAVENVIGKNSMLSEKEVTYNIDYSVATVDGRNIDLTGGYNLEFNNYEEDDYQFKTYNGCRVSINKPENLSDGMDVLTNNAYKYIFNFVQNAEGAVYGEDTKDLLKYIDIESFAKMWLLKEYIADEDATRNMHFWKESNITGDGKIHAGLPWDFDCSMDRDSTSVDSAEYSRITTNSEGSAKWLGQLLNHKIFREELYRQYTIYKDLFVTTIKDGIETSPLHTLAGNIADSYYESSKMDTVRWTGTEDYCRILDFTDEDRKVSLDVVKGFILERNIHIEERMDELDVKLHEVIFWDEYNDTSINMLIGSAGVQKLPVPNQVEGYTFVGWYNCENKYDIGMPVTENTVFEARYEPIIHNEELPDNNIEDDKYKENNIIKNDIVNNIVDNIPQIVPEQQIISNKVTLKKGDKLKDINGFSLYQVILSKNDNVKVSYIKPVKKRKKVVVPDEVVLADGTKAKVVKIAANAFKKCKYITSVVIGKNVKSIGSNAFAKINKKAVIYVPKKKLTQYKKILRKRGLDKKVKIKPVKNK